jgi:hypothetical protein
MEVEMRIELSDELFSSAMPRDEETRRRQNNEYHSFWIWAHVLYQWGRTSSLRAYRLIPLLTWGVSHEAGGFERPVLIVDFDIESLPVVAPRLLECIRKYLACNHARMVTIQRDAVKYVWGDGGLNLDASAVVSLFPELFRDRKDASEVIAEWPKLSEEDEKHIDVTIV